MPVIECITLDGINKMIPKDSLVFRPAVYAVVVHDSKVLLMTVRQTGKYHLPGGGINVGERIEDALKRELWEEAGIKVEIMRFARFDELFFYYNPSETAYHGLHFYYICRPRGLVLDAQVKDEASGEPRWVSIQNLQAQDFWAHGDIVLGLCKEIAAYR